jgi:glycosyltransferase involved in cell wall biosynthesis
VKILIGMPSVDSWGGPAACEPPFAEALSRQGHEVVTGTYVYGDKATPTNVFKRISRVLQTAIRFRRLIQKHSPEIMHLNTAFDLKTILRDSVTLFFAGKGTAKVFLKLHGSEADRFTESGGLLRMLINLIHRRTDAFGCLSNEEIDSFKRLGFDAKKLFLVSNAVDFDAKRIPGEARGDTDTFEILFASRFVRAKGLLETIRACELLRGRRLKFRLKCVGDGEILQEAKDLVGTLALGRVVTFTGFIPENEVNQHLQRADVLAFPTTHPEGFPIVVFKAMAAGLPIVTTKIRAAADRLSEPENCLFCTNDPESVADAIEQLANDGQMRTRMSANNVVAACAFSPDAVAGEYVRIYEKLLAS